MIENTTAKEQEVNLLYVNLKKASDIVPLNSLWESLELSTNINAILIKAVKKP